MKARTDYGQNSDLNVLTGKDCSSNNIDYRNFLISQQCETEITLICNKSNKLKLFYNYIKRKKNGKPPVGPLNIENRVISDLQEMSEVFACSFSSVFSPVLTQKVNPYLKRETEMSQLHLTIDKVFSQLNKKDESSAPGSDGINPKLLKSCAVTLSYPLLLLFIESS